MIRCILNTAFATVLTVLAWTVLEPNSALGQGSRNDSLVVMGDKNYPPYEFLLDGEPAGINVEIWMEIAAILGRPLDFRLYQWAESQERVRRGEGKVLSLLGITKERRKIYEFTRPTFSVKFPVFTVERKVHRFDIHDMTGQRIAVKKGGFPQTIMENSHPEAEMVLVDSALEGFRRLLRGEVDGVIENEQIGYHILRENGFDGISATPVAVTITTAHIAVIKGNQDLLHQIDDAVGELKRSGRFEQIVNNWAGAETVRLERRTVRLISTLAAAAVALLIIVGVLLYVTSIREINDALTREVAERKRAEQKLREAKELAERSDRFKSDFLTTMSHELRTPLNAILGFAGILEQETFGPLGDTHYKDYARYIMVSGQHLLELINDILDLSKIEAGKYELDIHEVDIQDLVAHVSDIIAAEAASKELHVRALVESGLPPLRADPRAVRQIVLNLLSNAVKFTPEKGSIGIWSARTREGGLDIAVADTGAGISEENMIKMFTPYTQFGDVHVANEHGTGLGLSIVKALAELHHANVAIESEEGGGTTVTVSFPRESLAA